MSIIKLDAIDSTNDFLKELLRNQSLENFTVIVANSQLKGRGQMGTSWDSESGKNLITSVLINDLNVKVEDIFVLNAMISTAVLEALRSFYVPNLTVKWPNDIMSEDKKIAGILIENTLKPDNKITSIIGIGLNVNQKRFDNLPNASSLFVQEGKEFSIDAILDAIIMQIKNYQKFLLRNEYEWLWKMYHQNLFKKDTPMLFEDSDNIKFIGEIKRVNHQGKLEVLINDNSIKLFSVKEIKMIY